MYKPERPEFAKELITGYTNENVPHFFKYAKDKNKSQVVESNKSFVNKLDKMIPNPRINCRKLGLNPIDCYLMMDNPDIECKVELTDKGKIVKENTDPLIVRYCELSKNHYLSLGDALRIDQTFSAEVLMKSRIKKDLKYKKAHDEIKEELSKFGYSDKEIADILVKFLYSVGKSKHKAALWLCYGDIIVENLEKYFKPQTKAVQCVDCGEWFEIGIFDSKTDRCEECYKEYRKAYYREKKREQRLKLKCPQTL